MYWGEQNRRVPCPSYGSGVVAETGIILYLKYVIKNLASPMKEKNIRTQEYTVEENNRMEWQGHTRFRYSEVSEEMTFQLKSQEQGKTEQREERGHCWRQDECVGRTGIGKSLGHLGSRQRARVAGS